MGTVTKIRGNEPQTVEEWREFIVEPWQKAVESIIETGKRLIHAKEKVEHGQWLKIFEGNKPFSERTAERLMAIARHSILSNPANLPVLPPSWSTLYELSQIPENILSRYIAEGKIYPELIGLEAHELKEYEDKVEEFCQLILGNAFKARELSLADCGGSPYDCSILEGSVPQEVIDKVQEVIDTWTSLRDHLLSLRQGRP